jgi:hypothetical protein
LPSTCAGLAPDRRRRRAESPGPVAPSKQRSLPGNAKAPAVVTRWKQHVRLPVRSQERGSSMEGTSGAADRDRFRERSREAALPGLQSLCVSGARSRAAGSRRSVSEYSRTPGRATRSRGHESHVMGSAAPGRRRRASGVFGPDGPAKAGGPAQAGHGGDLAKAGSLGRFVRALMANERRSAGLSSRHPSTSLRHEVSEPIGLG